MSFPLIYDHMGGNSIKLHGLIEGGIDRRSDLIVKQTHCLALGKFSSLCEEYIPSIFCEHLLCANTILGKRVNGMEINMLISHSFLVLTLNLRKVRASLMKTSTYQFTNSSSFS